MKSLIFPEGVTVLQKQQINDRGIQKVGLPKSLIKIGESTFCDCKLLQTISLPNGVTRIGDCAFCGCESIHSVSFSQSLQEIGNYAFFGSKSLQTISLPDNVTTIGDYTFSWCENLQTVNLSQSLQQIGHYTFYRCKSIKSISIPENVINIGNSALSMCENLQLATLPQSLQEISAYTFYECKSLQAISLPAGVKRVGDYAFYNCKSFQSVILPQSLQEIGDFAFSGCKSLHSIILPEGVTKIGHYAFSHCKTLRLIALPLNSNCPYDAFYGCTVLHTILQQNDVNILKTRFDHLPLHYHCYYINSYTTRTMMKQVQTSYQELITQDIMGMTPLHVLCSNPCATSAMIKQLLSRNPGATQVRSRDGMTPLSMYLISHQGVISCHDYKERQSNHYIDSKITALLEDGAEKNINEMMLMGLEYDMMSAILVLNGRNIEQELNEQNKETGLFPFMSAAISHNYKLHDVYRMAKENIHIMLSSGQIKEAKRRKLK